MQNLHPIALDKLLYTLEASGRAVAETTPANHMHMVGVIQPKEEVAYGDDGQGILAQRTVSQRTKMRGELSAKGPTSIYRSVDLLLMAAKGTVTAANPAGTSSTEKYTFNPSMTSDDHKSMTVWSGQPDLQVWRSAGMMLEELGWTTDTSGNNLIDTTIKATGLFPTEVSTPTTPDIKVDSSPASARIEVWMDDTSAIGTTKLDARVVKTNPKIKTGRVFHYDNVGPEGDVTITGVTVDKMKRGFDLDLTLHFSDLTQYNAWKGRKFMKVRIRIYGDLIETVSSTKYFEYLQLDVYGYFTALELGDVNKSKTVKFSLPSNYSVGAGLDWAAEVQRRIAV